MRVAVTGVALWTASGWGVAPLMADLDRGTPRFRDFPPCPWPWGGLPRPACAIAPGLGHDVADRPAERMLEAVVRGALGRAGVGPGGVGPGDVGLVVGTSSGNLCGPWEAWHRRRLEGRPSPEAGLGRDGPTQAVADRLGLGGPRRTVSVACASGTAALGLAADLVREGFAHRVVAAGVDAWSLFVHAGFAGLGALSASRPRPFHPDRDGLLLGEGAAALVLEPVETARSRGVEVLGEVLGWGSASDAFHLTAPHPEGRGLAAAARRALAEAGTHPDEVDVVSVHGTGTVFNDAMESRALGAVFGDRPLCLHGVKHVVGHTLGAAGAVEAVVALAALRRGRAPPGPTVLAGDCPVRPAPSPPGPRVALSLSSAFGGVNAAVLLGLEGVGQPRVEACDVEQGGVCERRWAKPPSWSEAWPDRGPRFGRWDGFVRGALFAGRHLAEELDVDAAVVVSSQQGCRETDLRYHARLVAEGPGAVSRMDFAATIPGIPAAEASLRWDLRGHHLALVGSEQEGLAEAERVVARGRAAAVLHLHCDAPDADGPVRAVARVLRRRPAR